MLVTFLLSHILYHGIGTLFVPFYLHMLTVADLPQVLQALKVLIVVCLFICGSTSVPLTEQLGVWQRQASQTRRRSSAQMLVSDSHHAWVPHRACERTPFAQVQPIPNLCMYACMYDTSYMI